MGPWGPQLINMQPAPPLLSGGRAGEQTPCLLLMPRLHRVARLGASRTGLERDSSATLNLAVISTAETPRIVGRGLGRMAITAAATKAS